MDLEPKRKARGASGLGDMFAKMYKSGPIKESVESLHSEFSDPSPSVVESHETTHASPVVAPSYPRQREDISSHATSDATCDDISVVPSHGATDVTQDVSPHATSVVPSFVSSHVSLDATNNLAYHVTSDEPPLSGTRQTLRDTERWTDNTFNRLTEHQTSQTDIRNTERTMRRDTPRRTERLSYLHDPVMNMTARQGMVLYYLLQRPDYIAQRHTMGQVLNLPLPTIRDSITFLVNERFITKPTKIVIRAFQGFTYRLLDEDQCARFMKLRGDEFYSTIERHTGRATERNTLRQTTSMYNVAYDDTTDDLRPFSSSLDSKKLTTNSMPTDPDFGFWKEEGVTERQLQNWESEFNLSRDDILLSLRYCRYDLLNNPTRNDVKNAQNWFYKIVKKAGLYPKPEGYRSLEELRLEKERAELEDLERQARELADIRKRKQVASLEIRFQQLLNEGSDFAEYDRLFNLATSFEKEMGGDVLESALRREFQRLNGMMVD